MNVRPRTPADEPAVRRFLTVHHSARVARLGELVDPLEHPALVADDAGRLVGVLTHVVEADRRHCEILTLHTAVQWQGVGTALIEAVERLARDNACTRLWLITTNDNVDALRFYQRRGFHLAALHPGAVDHSRTHLKPEIPEMGNHGIPLRDEIELAKAL